MSCAPEIPIILPVRNLQRQSTPSKSLKCKLNTEKKTEKLETSMMPVYVALNWRDSRGCGVTSCHTGNSVLTQLCALPVGTDGRRSQHEHADPASNYENMTMKWIITMQPRFTEYLPLLDVRRNMRISPIALNLWPHFRDFPHRQRSKRHTAFERDHYNTSERSACKPMDDDDEQ
ncbi:hypothetical protein BC629DRAFT_366275 [Irpex lacteus]|nr:hypothetical protein BC629DRAFT_366275 [Irpex lacteus]